MHFIKMGKGENKTAQKITDLKIKWNLKALLEEAVICVRLRLKNKPWLEEMGGVKSLVLLHE